VLKFIVSLRSNKFGMLKKLKDYIQESYQEFHRVNWPTRSKTVNLTLIVIGMSIGVAIFLGILDLIFTYLLESFII
jgi:preprotein translocase subunit SecE